MPAGGFLRFDIYRHRRDQLEIGGPRISEAPKRKIRRDDEGLLLLISHEFWLLLSDIPNTPQSNNRITTPRIHNRQSITVNPEN